MSLSVLFLVLLGAQPFLIEAHSNIAAVAGSVAIMKCRGSCENSYIQYQTKQDQRPVLEISWGSQKINDFEDRYRVYNSFGCNLLIKDVSLTDAGIFACAYPNQERNTVMEYSLLIVLESLPKCTAQVNASDGITAEGDEVQFICELRFNAVGGASMTWKTLENVSISVEPNTTGRLLHSVVVGRSEIPSYECITKFDLPKNFDGLARNIPIGPSCTTQPIRPRANDESSTRRDSGEQPTETSIGLKTFAIVIAVGVLLCIFSGVIIKFIFKRQYGSVATGIKSGNTEKEKKYQNPSRPTSQLNGNGEFSEHYETIELNDIGYETIDEYSLDDPNYSVIQDNEYLDVLGDSLDDNTEAEENDHSATDHDHQSEQTESHSG